MLPHQARSVDALEAALASGGEATWLYFWRHRDTDSVNPGPGVFSQWFPSPFVVDGETYATAEHWMMAGKARLFGDHDMAQAILADDSPARAQRRGRKVRGFRQPVWEAHRFELVVQGSVHKFTSTPVLRNFLLGTGPSVLVEASPMDRIWGIGLVEGDAVGVPPSDWRGLNLLGFALMEARARIAADSGEDAPPAP